ncbi:hypothetical protein FRB93_000252 [Tulasnella sp. JGI-2019a]|nr:hypothetical protein FRB93_000252 [Tulasnella sp. JGI-2019a]
MFSRLVSGQAPSTLIRRQASTSSNSTGEKASELATKASQTATKYAGELGATAQKYAGPLGERLGNLAGAYREPIQYNSQVFLHLLKTVYKRENLAPPTSLHQVTSAYRTMFDRAKSLPYWQDLYASGEYKKVAISAAEVYGIFKLGEIVGRRSLIGYNVE